MKVTWLPSCRVTEWSQALHRIFTVALSLPEDLAGVGQLVVTSINDNGPRGGGHSRRPKSRHYSDEAIDLRTHTIPASQRVAVRDWLQARLGGQFTVLLEDPNLPNEHLHIQVRKGHVFQP